MERAMALRLTPFIAIAAALGLHSTAQAQTANIDPPRAVVIYGAPLRERIVLFGWPTTMRFMGGLALASNPTAPAPSPDRRSLGIALFWSAAGTGVPMPPDSAAFAQLHPALADQHGRFFPARGSEPALVTLEPMIRRAGVRTTWAPMLQDGLALLAERGVPTRVPAR
jgi:hypothetical protein